MSNAIFPNLPGLCYDRDREPEFNNIVQRSISGKETAIGLWSYPIYNYTNVKFDILRSATAFLEYQSLVGFFLARNANFDTWLFDDPDDDYVSGQQLGIGDGNTKSFRLVRSLGGWTDQIMAVNGTPQVFVGSVQQMSGWSVDSGGNVVFTNAPALNASVTATFYYYWRCRFDEVKLPFTLSSYRWWECKKLSWHTVK